MKSSYLKKLDDRCTAHFEELVEKDPRKVVAVVNEQIVAIGESELEVHRKALQKNPNEIPLVVTVPSEEDLVCLLFA